MKWALIVGVGLFVLLLWRIVWASAARLPRNGEAAPAFSLQDQDGRTRSLDDFRGKWLALYFFPRADTPG